MSTYIYIDDTGTPGIRSMSKYSDTDRKTWVALILNQEQNSDIKRQMLECISELKKVSKADEFHFTDIYSGSGKFKDVSPDTRFALFQFVAEIYRLTNFPLLIQTFTKDDLLRNRIIVPKQPVKADGFDLSKTSDMALLFLLVRIKILFKEKNKYRLPASIIIDEGRQKPNTIQKNNTFKEHIKEWRNQLYFL